MPKGISLHIGLNTVDPRHYDGWDGLLNACESDARDMFKLAKANGFAPGKLLTKQATADAVVAGIAKAAKALRSGDIFFLTYSGHGGQVPDTNSDEDDDSDETWVLYDRQLVDDELYELWGTFRPGVRVLVLSDSCHSGTVTRLGPIYDRLAAEDVIPKPSGYRGMPASQATRVYRKNKALYDRVQKEHPTGENVSVGASVLLISGCRDNQLSLDGDRNGLFTGTLLDVWRSGAFKGGYRKFHKEVLRRMPFSQSPNLFLAGARDARFERERPFTI